MNDAIKKAEEARRAHELKKRAERMAKAGADRGLARSWCVDVANNALQAHEPNESLFAIIYAMIEHRIAHLKMPRPASVHDVAMAMARAASSSRYILRSISGTVLGSATGYTPDELPEALRQWEKAFTITLERVNEEEDHHED